MATFFVTVTAQVAERLVPSVVVTVMVAEPGAMAFTSPLPSTVATAVLLLFHVRACEAALSGFTVAVSCIWLPSTADAVVWLSVIDCARLAT